MRRPCQCRIGSGRARETSFVLAGLLAALFLSGCFGKKAKQQPPAPPPPPVQAAPAKAEPPSEPPPTITLNPPPNPLPPVVVRPPAPTEPRILTEAEDKFAIANYGGAVKDYEKFLHEYPVHKDVPQALFRLGLAYALSGPSAQNQKKALDMLRSVVKDHPFSPYKAPSEYILNLLAEIERLKTENDTKEESIKRLKEELERIKKIDMERRPTKPPQ